MYQLRDGDGPAKINVGASVGNMNQETRDTILAAKCALTTVLEIMNDVDAGRETYSSACSKHGLQYMRFKYFVRKLANFEGLSEKEIAVPKYEPTSAENLYSRVFGVPVEEVNEMMPDDAEEAIETVLATLMPREVEIVRMRLDGKFLDEVGRAFNITRERVRQIEAKAYRKLRHPSRSRILRLGENAMQEAETELEQERNELVAKYKERLRANDEAYQEALVGMESLDRYENALAEVDEGELRVENITLEEMNLSVRSYNCCRRAGITCVGDFKKYDIEQLMRIRNLGRRSLEEIIKKLASYGIEIK